MKKIITLSILTVVLFDLSLGFANANNDSEVKQLEKSVVWEVTGPNIEQPSYLVGTMHIMCEKDFAISPKIKNVFNQVEQAYFEMDMDNPDLQGQMMSAMVAKEPLKKRFSEAQYKQFAEFLEQHSQYRISMFEQLEYIAIISALTVESLACPNVKTFDTELAALAQKLEMPIYGFETVAEQMQAVTVMNPKKGQLMSEKELEMFAELDRLLNQMVDLYHKEDIVGMFDYMSNYPGSVDNWDEVQKVILDDRNKNWVTKIFEIIQKKPTVFAFGAGHLAGEQGVIQLLRDAGLNVKPIMK